MESENSIEMSRPKTQRRLNLDSSQKLPHVNNIRSSSFDMASMSPMTNLVHNLSGASLDSTPKRRFLSHGNLRFQQLKGYITTDNAFPVCGDGRSLYIFRSALMPSSCCGLTCGLSWKVHNYCWSSCLCLDNLDADVETIIGSKGYVLASLFLFLWWWAVSGL